MRLRVCSPIVSMMSNAIMVCSLTHVREHVCEQKGNLGKKEKTVFIHDSSSLRKVDLSGKITSVFLFFKRRSLTCWLNCVVTVELKISPTEPSKRFPSDYKAVVHKLLMIMTQYDRQSHEWCRDPWKMASRLMKKWPRDPRKMAYLYFSIQFSWNRRFDYSKRVKYLL